MGRFEKSVLNLFAAWGGQAVAVLFTFATRSVFAYHLSMDYLGLESLFSNILSVLSLADLGIGTAITFALYRPIALNDVALVKSLMRIFKRTYIAIGSVIIAAGFFLAPFVRYLIEGAPDISNLEMYFFFFVFNTGVSYFFSYKAVLISANQKNHIVSLVQYGFQVVMCIAQMAVILLLHSYLGFLVCMLLSTIVQNIVLSILANSMYPFLRERDVRPVPKEIMREIVKNTSALIVHRVAGAASTPASSIIISTFSGIRAIALYGNYILVLNSVQRLLSKVFDAIQASVGNLGATEDPEYQYKIFEETLFCNGLICTAIYVVLLSCFNPIVTIWLGEEYEFPFLTVLLLVFWYFTKGMRSAVLTFTNAYGLYWRTWYKAVFEAVVLLCCSLLLVQQFSVNGVVVAGIVSSLLISSPLEAFALFKYGFKKPLAPYFACLAKYYILAAGAGFASIAVCSFVRLPLPAQIAFNVFISLVCCVAVFCIFMRKTTAYAGFVSLIQRMFDMIKRLRKSDQPD